MAEYKDVEIMFKTSVNKDVVLKNVIVRQFKEGTITCFSPDEEHKFVFNMDEISYIHVSDHGSECSITGTHDECIYDFSDEPTMLDSLIERVLTPDKKEEE